MREGIRALLLEKGPSPEETEARYYLRVTLVVTAGMAAGALAQWLTEPATPWRWLPFGLAYLVGGYRIAIDTWAHLRGGRLSIDFLMGTAAVGAAILGNPLEGSILIFLFSLSNTLEAFALGRTRRSVESLLDLRPQEATLAERDGSPGRRIPADDLEPEDRILVRPGERIPADGEVEEGGSEVDQAPITGESAPVRKGPGDEVFAGTFNEGGAIVVRVTRRSEETMLARIVRLVHEARERRAPAQHFIDRFAHPYVALVVAATVLVALIPWWWFGVPWADALYRAITLLVVASPCALVISTPAAILSGISNGARHGVLFKGGAYLDLAGTIDTIAFDKTGTLTEGRPRLVELVTRESLVRELSRGSGSELLAASSPRGIGSPDGDEEPPTTGSHPPLPLDEHGRQLLRLAAAAESNSEHHLARAILDAARTRGLEPDPVRDFRAVPGEGVSASVNGNAVWVGNATMADRMGARPGPVIRGWTAEQTSLGRSVTYVGEGSDLIGAMSFGDVLKPDAAAAVRHLKYEGIRWLTILSGDHPDTVRAVAAELGVDEVRAGLLPHEKVEAVRILTERSRGVAMVGDGVNDAPAMATATLGVAMGAVGTDVAIETADVVLMSDELARVDYLIHLGKRTRRIVRQNVWFSVGWMALLVVVVSTVGIPLTLAVVAHEGSTLLVVLNGLRLLGGGPHAQTIPKGSGSPSARTSFATAGPSAAR